MEMIGTNIAKLYTEDGEDPILEAEAQFEVFEEGDIRLTKTVDRPGELYFPGEHITFTITIRNTTNIDIEDLVFKDTIPLLVDPLSGVNFGVTTDCGNVVSTTRTVEVDNIDLDAGETCTITIQGIIA